MKICVGLGLLLFSLSYAWELSLIMGAEVYTPDPIGRKNILIAGTKILQILDPTVYPYNVRVNVINGTGMILVPGLIDVHCHAAGGGGEAGPQSRTPEAQFDQLIIGGVTSLVGLLGTDSISRSEPNLLAKLKGLTNEGLSTFMWSGAYHVPTPSLTGSLQSDLIVVSEVIGAGEIAISDHRSSIPSFEEVARIVADCRVGGMLSGKAGVTHFHVGTGQPGLDLLWRILKETSIPITQMYPTHMSSRGEKLIKEGIDWISAGGYLDFTADDGTGTEDDTLKALLYYKSLGVPLNHVSLSSDSYGSNPTFDSHGNLIAYGYVKPVVMLDQIRGLILEHKWSITEAFQLSTRVPGKFLKLQKGEIIEGYDADFLLLDKKTLKLEWVISKGQILKNTTWIKPPMVQTC